MKKQIVRISIVQSSKILVALYAFMGLIYSLIGIPMVAFGHDSVRIVGIVYIFGPVWMAIVGFIFFAIGAAIYNLLAGWLGGFEVETRNIE